MTPSCEDCGEALTVEEYHYWVDNGTSNPVLCSECLNKQKGSHDLQSI